MNDEDMNMPQEGTGGMDDGGSAMPEGGDDTVMTPPAAPTPEEGDDTMGDGAMGA